MGGRASARRMRSNSFGAISSGATPKLSIYKMRCTRSQTPSENSFFSALLHAANHPAQNGASKAALRGRLLHKLRQVADKKGDDRVVLFADEAQNLHELHYEWLRD